MSLAKTADTFKKNTALYTIAAITAVSSFLSPQKVKAQKMQSGKKDFNFIGVGATMSDHIRPSFYAQVPFFGERESWTRDHMYWDCHAEVLGKGIGDAFDYPTPGGSGHFEWRDIPNLVSVGIGAAGNVINDKGVLLRLGIEGDAEFYPGELSNSDVGFANRYVGGAVASLFVGENREEMGAGILFSLRVNPIHTHIKGLGHEFSSILSGYFGVKDLPQNLVEASIHIGIGQKPRSMTNAYGYQPMPEKTMSYTEAMAHMHPLPLQHSAKPAQAVDSSAAEQKKTDVMYYNQTEKPQRQATDKALQGYLFHDDKTQRDFLAVKLPPEAFNDNKTDINGNKMGGLFVLQLPQPVIG